MTASIDRRAFVLSSVTATGLLGLDVSYRPARQPPPSEDLHPEFPRQDPAVVREVVSVAHRDLDQVRALVENSPALARATWDWGFGDWESALGAAAHTGQRGIAEYLLERGARPTLFSAAMLGQLAVVRAFVEASPGVQRIPGPHGITLLSHAKAGGEDAVAVVEYLERVGDADVRPTFQSLSPEERTRYVGMYAYGTGPTERLEVVEGRSRLTIGRPDGVSRLLFYLGSDEFFPTGAPAVRVRFGFEGSVATTLTVVDAAVAVTATRMA